MTARRCAGCGRRLHDPVSTSLGWGPVCRRRLQEPTDGRVSASQGSSDSPVARTPETRPLGRTAHPSAQLALFTFGGIPPPTT
ncbi:DUF6011 domain-containing protein, partial [Streptomyces boncukensis]|uniref:DUF6011 domain-containing protein n=1 Tax=Streptomyces boncukensis TaxID=2711219 RepID=UPI003B96B95E